MLSLSSKLPNQGTTIFSVMSALAQQLNALNLSQGFPDFPAPQALLDLLNDAAQQGYNQYSPGHGLLLLRQQVVELMINRDPQLQLDLEREVTITSGATIALHSAIQALVQPHDEVIVFDPSYDSYAPCIELAQGKPIHLALQAPHFSVDWQQVKDNISDKTRMIIVNTPHNPTGTVWSKQDWLTLVELIQDRNIVVLSDEVYEHLIFDGQPHYSALSFPQLRHRAIVVGSFGKTFHVTGWKTGYCIAAPELTQLFRQVYQFASFCGVTPVQMALAQFMKQHPEHIQELAGFYQRKRDLFLNAIQHSNFLFQPSQGTYFQTLDYRQIQPTLTDREMCYHLAEQYKIVAIPLSAFYKSPPKNLTLLRFCFAKHDHTLQQAADILNTCS